MPSPARYRPLFYAIIVLLAFSREASASGLESVTGDILGLFWTLGYGLGSIGIVKGAIAMNRSHESGRDIVIGAVIFLFVISSVHGLINLVWR